MPLYDYKALSSDDKLLEGQMEAATEKAVISKLQKMGYFPITTRMTNDDIGQNSVVFKNDLSSSEVLLVTQKLAVTMRAGLTLDAALALLIETADSEKLKAVLEKVVMAVHNGISLSDAFQQYSKSFDRFYINTLRAGESSGSLEHVLARLASYLERSQANKKTIQAALMYPAILVVVACLTLLILLVYVVPQFQTLFEDMGQALPMPTQIVIAMANGVEHYGWIGILIGFALFGFFRHMLRDSKKRVPIDRAMLRLPVVSEMIIRLEVTRFSRALATLLNNGVSMLAALNIVAESLNNSVVRQSLTTLKNSVKDGQSIAGTLKKQKLFPPMAIQLIQVGEETGELVGMLEQVADIYETELQDTVQRFLTLLEPLLIITLGIVIAGIIIAILLAILALNDFAV